MNKTSIEMNKTSIEWVKNPDGTQGYTWNPITGCLNHINGMCKGGGFPCYAYKLANGRLRTRYLANSNLPSHDEPDHEAHHSDPFYPRFWEDRLCRPWGGKPKGIFVCDMSDLFGVGIPELWTKRVLLYCKVNRKHRFYLLTKQPQNLIKFSPFPDNCWVGVTVTNPNQLAHAINGLALVEAKVKYYSFEPLLERMIGHTEPLHPNHLADIQWVIIGAQTKPYKPPEWDWVREIIEACDKAGASIFLKDNLGLPRLSCEGATPFYKKHPSGTMELRQEMPDKLLKFVNNYEV